MITCKKCNKHFLPYVKIDGIRKNLHNRKYCLECSPWGKHNTAPIKNNLFQCKHCNDTDVNNFYSYNKVTCKKCFNQNWTKQQQDNRIYVVNKLGGKCYNCGFNTWICSLDVHHLDPSIKDKGFRNYKTWCKEKLDKEIENCILLCSNCHNAFHNGYIKLST